MDSIDEAKAYGPEDDGTGSHREGADSVDLWLWNYDQADPDIFDTACRAWLSPEEKARIERMRFERDRRLHTAARVLVRRALSDCAAKAPGQWRFITNRFGKPRVARQAGDPAPHFNLAHTIGLVACVVSQHFEEIGVDVERLDRQADFLGVSETCFAPVEQRLLGATEPSLLPRRFLASWTIKESYAKARGRGLSLPLDSVQVVPEDDGGSYGRLGVSFEPRLGDREDSWRFALIEAAPCHLVAVAVRAEASPVVLRTGRFQLGSSDIRVTGP
ncbi:MAG: 4'-phosphopantetheinyl transferase superfamily protein [Chromatiaceae bacterium]|nr:4'-phosphopantetheinyl transferase superfamily protein [Chromatiaceae bacterium]